MKLSFVLILGLSTIQDVFAFGDFSIPTYGSHAASRARRDPQAVAPFSSGNFNLLPAKPITSLLNIFPRAPQSDDGPQSAAAEAAEEHHTGGFRTIPTTPTSRRVFRTAHGVLMATTFTLLLPLGAIVMRTTHRAYLHAGIQSFAYLCAIAGMGLGIWLGRNVRYLDYAHTVIGMCVLAALLFQVVFGVVAHLAYVKSKKENDGPGGHGRRKPLKFVHRWLGRCLIALGIINGGLGLKLAQNTTGGIIAYSIVAGLVGLLYMILIVLGIWKGDEKSKVSNEGMEM